VRRIGKVFGQVIYRVRVLGKRRSVGVLEWVTQSGFLLSFGFVLMCVCWGCLEREREGKCPS
jgi:hypothetical protein